MRIVILICILAVSSCNMNNKQVGFSLIGTTNDLKENTKLYLEDFESKKVLDSTNVVNGNFEFQTILRTSPIQALVRTADSEQRKSFWLENKKMTLDARRGVLKDAVVSGSKTDSLSSIRKSVRKVLKYRERLAWDKEFVETHPNTVLSAYILSGHSTIWGKESTVNLYDAFSDDAKESVYGERIRRFIDLSKEPQIGDAYVNLTLNDTSGVSKMLSENLGRITLIEFWAGWCGPCREENPNLVKTYNEHKKDGFEVYAVSLDDSEELWKEAIKEDDLPWLQVSDLLGNQSVPKLTYGVSGIPDNFLVDNSGEIIARGLRGEKLDAKIKELLAIK